LRLTLTAGPGGYAGGGLSFDRCVRVPAANALRFTAWLASGDQKGCSFRVMLQTFEQRPSTQSPPGGCASDVSSCYNFPSSPNITLATTSTPLSVAISAFTTSVPHAMPIESQIIGLQWQLDSPAPVVDGGASQVGCTVEAHLDDIDFIEP